MGLDLELLTPVRSLSCPYSAFGHFRQRLARDGLGIDLNEMKGFRYLGRSWDEFSDDPLTRLLNHSDCDGELDAIDCEGLAERIRATVRYWPDDDYRQYAEALADMAEAAVDEDGVIQFR